MEKREAALAMALLCAVACADETNDEPTKSVEPQRPVAAADDKEATPNEDPAPEHEKPGVYTCKGCPSSADTDLEVNVGGKTSQEFTGNVKDAEGNGTFHIEGPEGQTISGTIETKDNGDFAFDAPLFCGEQTVKTVWSNEEGRYVLVRRVTTTDCTEPALRVTLAWDGEGQDFELHLVQPGGRINDNATDCTWTSCIAASPDWGIAGNPQDDPKKDVDHTGKFGPENIYLQAPAAGTYTVLVEHWATGKPTATGNVIINVRGQEMITIPIDDLPHGHVFTAATVEFPSGKVTAVATEYDCTKDWEKGCQAKLPAAM